MSHAADPSRHPDRVSLLTTECVCGERSAAFLGHKDGRAVGRCTQCQLVRTLERAAEYERLYTEGEQYHDTFGGHVPYRERCDHDRNIAQLRLPKIAQCFRWLDVGSANGAFVAEARELGYAAYGLELNPHIARWSSDYFGIPVYTSWAEIQQERADAFDVITYHDVFEHVVDPAEELRIVRGHLIDGGLLVLDVPDADDPRFKELGMGWHHMRPQEHLWFWTESALVHLLESHGFVIQSVDRPIQGKLVVYARRHHSY